MTGGVKLRLNNFGRLNEFLMCLFVVPGMCGCSGRALRTRKFARRWIHQPRAVRGYPVWMLWRGWSGAAESSPCPLGGNAGWGRGSLLLRACRAPCRCTGISSSHLMPSQMPESTAFSRKAGLGNRGAGGSAPKPCIDVPYAVVHICNFSM